METDRPGEKPNNPEPEQNVFLTINEAAEKTGYDGSWIWRLAHKGKVESRVETKTQLVQFQRVISIIQVNLNDLLRYMEENQGPRSQQELEVEK